MNSLMRWTWIALGVAIGIGALVTFGAGRAQTVDTTPSRKTLEDASRDNCEGVSSVVQRCAQNPVATPPPKKPDELTKSRTATKAAFDRVDKRGEVDAINGKAPSTNTPVGDAQQLGGVTVTGKNDAPPPNIEETLQKALEQPTVSPNGTVSKYAPNGTRYDCIAKCVGPACCVEVRTMPNPVRDINGIGH